MRYYTRRGLEHSYHSDTDKTFLPAKIDHLRLNFSQKCALGELHINNQSLLLLIGFVHPALKM